MMRYKNECYDKQYAADIIIVLHCTFLHQELALRSDNYHVVLF